MSAARSIFAQHRERSYTLAGVEVRTARPDGGVIWCSHWERIDELVALGYLRRVHYGPATYGAVGYFLERVR